MQGCERPHCVRSQFRLGPEHPQRGRLRLVRIQSEPASVQRVEVERLASGEGGLVGERSGWIRNADYQKLRRRLMNDGRSKVLVPTFVRTCRDPRLWGYIKACSRITPSVERSSVPARGVRAG